MPSQLGNVKPRLLDLFAGAGGWDVAARDLGLDPLGIECDGDACATREAAGLATVQRDVASLDPHDFAPCDLLIASPPCQAWSMAGKRQGQLDITHVYGLTDWIAGRAAPPDREQAWADERSRLVVEPLRWALVLRPRFIALEQVPPVLGYWHHVACILREEGYSVWAGILSAERYGVPQTRGRAILMASLDARVAPPEPTHQAYVPGEPARREEGLFGSLEPWISMAEALGWGEGRVGFPRRNDTPSNRATSGDEGEYRERDLRNTDEPAFNLTEKARSWTIRTNDQPNATVRGLDEPAPTIKGGHDHGERCWVHERPAPTIVTTRRSKDGIVVGRQLPEGEGENVGGWGYERPSTTVNGDPRISKPGHHDGAVSGSQQKDAVRVSLQEAAILQGFPPDHPWQGSRTACFTQVGNAVPPPLARAVLAALMAHLNTERAAA